MLLGAARIKVDSSLLLLSRSKVNDAEDDDDEDDGDGRPSSETKDCACVS